MSCSKYDVAAGSLPIPEWKPPSPENMNPKRFTTAFEKFGYNNFSNGELKEHNALMARTMKMAFLEVVFPFGTFAASIRDADILSGAPLECSVFKSDKENQLFVVKTALFERADVCIDSVTNFKCVFTEEFVGETWDKRCLGIAITFGERMSVINGRFQVGCAGELVARPPLCSFMTRNKSGGKAATKKLGSYDRTGFPISSFVIGTRMFFALGAYFGVGFGNDLVGCVDFINLIETINDRRKEAWRDPAHYSECFDHSAPLGGALCNIGSIAYVAGVSFKDDDVDRLMLVGSWGVLLDKLMASEGIMSEGSYKSRRFIRADVFDELYETGNFLLVSCLEYITSAIAGEVVQEVLLPNGVCIKLDNDVGLYRRNQLHVRRR